MISDMDSDERDGIRLNGMVLVSLLIHAAVLSLFFFSPSFPSPKHTFGPAHTVSLVSLPKNAREPRSGPAAAKELMTADSSMPSATVIKKKIEPAPVIPIQRAEPRKKTAPDLDKVMEEIRKKANLPSVRDTVKQPKGPATPEKASAPAAVSQPGDPESKARMNDYYAAIWSRIRGKWALPQGILSGEPIETVIAVTILRSGAVAGMDFEKRSGNRYFDESAVKAVQKATPFPPLPAWIGDNSIEVGIRFHSAELKP